MERDKSTSGLYLWYTERAQRIWECQGEKFIPSHKLDSFSRLPTICMWCKCVI